MDFRRKKPALLFWRLGHFLVGVFGIFLFGVDTSNFENLFINQNAPFNPVSTGIIRYILRNAFAAANINIVGKKCGPHSLRSSLASAMVNSGVPYEVVQRQLEHTSDHSLRSYVRFDIEKLRVCASELQPATGNFKLWLEGRI